jgi:membrane-bound lytic murein transglycosylase D
MESNEQAKHPLEDARRPPSAEDPPFALLSGSAAELPIRVLTTMRTTAAMLVALVLGAVAFPSAAEELPRPQALEPQVRFWARIYSEVDSGGGLLHDAVHMDVVYGEIRVPRGLSRRGRERHVNRAKKKYVAALRKLGAGRRSGLSDLEQRVLALWPPDVSNATLRSAVKNVRFQRGQADRFRDGVIRAGLYEPWIREVFADAGIPPDVAALPHVESSFNPRAYSSAGAAGLWQFTRSTGRLYMRVDWVVDERMDPFIATEAAARLLNDNYRELKTWPLAITAYNHGQAGMSRAVRTTGTRDIATIVRRYKGRAFKFASRNFYTELLAAVDVERDAEKHFGPLDRHDPAALESVTLDAYYKVASLEQALGIDSKALRQHNLSLQPSVWRGQKYVPRGFELRIPRDPSGASAATALAAVPASQRYAKQKRDSVHRVQRGETLSQIARRYGVSQQALVDLNGLRSRHRIRQGQRLRLPGVEAPTVAAAGPATLDGDGRYHVRRGDTVSGIAARFGVSESDLVATNSLRNKNRLYVGQPLRVPGAVAAPKPAASEPAPPPAPPAVTLPDVPGRAPIVVAVRETPAAEPQAPAPAAGAATEPEPRASAEAPQAPSPDEVLPWRTPDVDAAAPSPDASPEAAAPTIVPLSSPTAAAPATPPRAAHLAVGPDDHIVVEAGETLGHFADWLQVPTSRLRHLNGFRPRSAIVIGQRVQLDFSRVSRSEFDARRRSHHAAIRDDFFARYRVAGTRIHVLRRGDTLWSLSRRHRAVPIWLLREYNPDVNLQDLQPGSRITIPRLERKST